MIRSAPSRTSTGLGMEAPNRWVVGAQTASRGEQEEAEERSSRTHNQTQLEIETQL